MGRPNTGFILNKTTPQFNRRERIKNKSLVRKGKSRFQKAEPGRNKEKNSKKEIANKIDGEDFITAS